mgnify:CR=1 FL=1
MATHVAKYARDSSLAAPVAGHLNLLTDLSRDPVFLSGRVKPSPEFAQAMLVLGKIAKTYARASQKDHSAYQEWVRGEYLKDLGEVRADKIARLPALRKTAAALGAEIKDLEVEARKALSDLKSPIRQFWDWLYTHNRAAWIVIDPVVSVQHDATFFEAFSIDESIYGRVKLPHSAVESESIPIIGTTNIDFGLGMEREFARIRSYRPMNLTVGSTAVEFKTDIATAVEKKIDLPDAWVRGLVEVQAALVFAPMKICLNPLILADIIAELEKKREKHGPRSLKFILNPGKPIQIELEPWGKTFVDPGNVFGGSEESEIRVWGRRRLAVLKDLLAGAESLSVQLVGSGMPSFWTVIQNGIELTVGLSGWTNLDWASRARFSSMIPTGSVPDQVVARAAAILKTKVQLSPQDLSDETELSIALCRSALQKLCLAGKAMFDAGDGTYRWRELFADFDLNRLPDLGLEERKGVELHAAGSVKIESDVWKDGRRSVSSKVDHQETNLETDVDGRVLYAECSCPNFRRNKLKQGPCRHLVALAASE